MRIGMKMSHVMPGVLIVLLIACTGASRAETADDAQKQLSGTLTEIKSATKKQKELEQKRDSLEKEMKALQEETVELADSAKQQEDALEALEEKNAILETQKKEKLATLEARKEELSETISAMMKLSKLPPEMVIAMPGQLQEILSAARALQVITQSVEEESKSLKEQLHELEALEQKIARNRDTLLREKGELSARHKQLAEKLKERNRIHASLSGKAQEEKQRMQKLTEKSKTLQELVDTLGKAEKEAAESQARSANTANTKSRSIFSFLGNSSRKARNFGEAKGKLAMPVSGKIIGTYGHSESGAAFSKGVMIEARGAGNVVAPYDGEVVYAGLFRDYGKMVIIRHNGDYHTLLSGMEEINCTPGQFLLEGEPIGAMGKPTDGGKPHLYVEMRKSGKPVDPMTWFRG